MLLSQSTLNYQTGKNHSHFFNFSLENNLIKFPEPLYNLLYNVLYSPSIDLKNSFSIQDTPWTTQRLLASINREKLLAENKDNVKKRGCTWCGELRTDEGMAQDKTFHSPLRLREHWGRENEKNMRCG